MSAQPAPTGVSPHIRDKRERRRAEILHAALRAFQEKGFHSTTLDDIAEFLGLRKTALYHYFPDKESILWACHQESLAELDRIIEGTSGLESASERLAYVIREHVRVMTDTLQGSPLAFEVGAFSPERQKVIIAARDAYEHAVREIIADGMARGEFRTVDPKISAFAILGSINWIARWFDPDGALRSEALGEQFATHLVGGLTCGSLPSIDPIPTQSASSK